jgi:hypothetical protein
MIPSFPSGSAGQPGFVMLGCPFMQLAAEKGLSDYGFRVYTVLASHVNRATGMCFPGYERIAAMTGKSVRSVHNAIHELEEMGFILIERSRRASGRWGRNLYKMLTPWIDHEPKQAEPVASPEIDCITPAEEAEMNAQSAAGIKALLAKAKQTALAKHDESQAKKAEKVAKKQSDPAPDVGHGDGDEKPAKPLNSNHVRAWFDQARLDYWSALKFLPPWTGKEMALAKKLLEVYDPVVLQKMIAHLWLHRARYKCTSVPTPTFLWAVQSRVFGEISQSEEVGAGSSFVHDQAGGHAASKAERLKKGEWDQSQSLTGGKGGVVDLGDMLKQMGID